MRVALADCMTSFPSCLGVGCVPEGEYFFVIGEGGPLRVVVIPLTFTMSHDISRANSLGVAFLACMQSSCRVFTLDVPFSSPLDGLDANINAL